MNGDTHFEVVLDTTGSYSVLQQRYEPLPATIASEVRIAVIPNGRSRETIAMEPDPTNSHWVGRARRRRCRRHRPGGLHGRCDALLIDVPASAWISSGFALVIARRTPLTCRGSPDCHPQHQKAASAMMTPIAQFTSSSAGMPAGH